MEIEPHVVQVLVSFLELFQNFSHLGSNTELTTLSVDQVDEVLLFVIFLSVCNVEVSSLVAHFEVGLNRHGW